MLENSRLRILKNGLTKMEEINGLKIFQNFYSHDYDRIKIQTNNT